jgi:ATP phosphoribosyltransferase
VKTNDPATLRVALPKGRMQEGVTRLLTDAGIQVRLGERAYRPTLSLPATEVKLLKPQNAVEMLHAGSRDIGFAGADWVAELGTELIELLDTGLDPVRVVAAAPANLLDSDGRLPTDRRLVIASEYTRITEDWIAGSGLTATFLRSYGATEVFPPEDADCIVDNTATGATLRANGLQIVDELMTSSTRLYAFPGALEDPERRARIEDLILLLRSVLDARQRVMLELNVDADSMPGVIEVLPAMRLPTVSPLHPNGGFAVRAAVLRSQLPSLVPVLKARGATDLVVTTPTQIVI